MPAIQNVNLVGGVERLRRHVRGSGRILGGEVHFNYTTKHDVVPSAHTSAFCVSTSVEMLTLTGRTKYPRW